MKDKELRIYIPTFRRNERQITLRYIPKEWRRHTTFVVDGQDAAVLAKQKDTRDIRIWRHPKRIKSIAQKRAWILENTKHRYILMLDDDLRFSKRIYVNDEKNIIRLLTADPEDVGRAFDKIAAKLRKYAHATISPRQMNNQDSNAKLRGWKYCARAIYALGYDVKIMRKRCKFGRIEHREDMDYTLQLLKQGYQNACYMEVVCDQVYNSKGGASLERSMEASNADAVKLAKLHKPFVKVVDKDYSISVPRKEVIVFWQKAFKASQERSR